MYQALSHLFLHCVCYDKVLLASTMETNTSVCHPLQEENSLNIDINYTSSPWIQLGPSGASQSLDGQVME